MLRYPCGPPSQRHQISGACRLVVRSRVVPASANCHGRRAGLPATSRAAPASARDDRAARVRRYVRPPVEPAEERGPQGQQRRPAVGRGRVEQQGSSFVAVTLPRRAQSLVKQCSAAVDHRAQPLPGGCAQRAAGCLGLNRGEQAEFRDETLVVGGELAADARREGVADQLVL